MAQTPHPHEVESLLARAAELPPGERERFLEESCTADPDLARSVEAMLESRDRADRYFQDLASRILPLAVQDPAAAATPASPHDLRPPHTHPDADAADAPRQVGPFRILRLLGRGGMGAVYLGEREGDFEQRVAVKLLPAVLRSEVFEGRFTAERRILARLDHPNVARLIDGGLLGDGTPYLVMEHVDGVAIDRHCDDRGLGVGKRLRLFLQVAEAVQFAHGRLVVHRDIKPSNILVAPEGRVKLLDFGVAKVLDEEDAAGEATFLTRVGGRPMTPPFAAPEQVAGDPVTTAADIYALGALLYLLLTGRPPLDLRGLSPGALERVVKAEEPPLPSEAVLRNDQDAPWGTPEERSRRRGSTPDSLRRRLRGDLDQILLKALRKEPQERYASVAQFAEDVERHLAGLPVSARPASAWYRLTKAVRRHPWGSAAAVGVPFLLVGALTAHTTRLEAERDLARAEAARAEQVTGFLVELFEASDPAEARGEALTARELLDRGRERLGRLEDQPEARAQMLDVLSRVYRALGLLEESRSVGTEAQELRRGSAPRGAALELARSLDNLGLTLAQMGEYAEAEGAHREALDLVKEAAGPDHEEVASVLNNLASALRSRGDLDGAEAAHLEALEIRRERFGDGSPEVATSLNNLGVLAHSQGRYREAEDLWRQAAGIRLEALGEDHPNTLMTLANLAAAVAAGGDYEGAEEAYLRVLDIRRRVLGPAHPDVATTLHQVGFQRWSRGDPEGAESPWREALEIRRSALGEDHPSVALSLNALAAVARGRGDLVETERLLEAALVSQRAALGPEHPSVATTLNNLGAVRFERGDHVGGRTLYREALQLRRQILGEDHPDVAHVLHNLGQSFLETGEPDRGTDYLARALAIREEALGPEHPATQETRERMEEARRSPGGR